VTSRPWTAAEAARLRAFHDPQELSIERPRAGADGYTSVVGVAATTDNIRAARIGATPLVRAARRSGVDE